MTHARQYDNDEGTFNEWKPVQTRCPKCQQTDASYRVWESNDGAYEDVQYQCLNPACRHVWWVDGIDS